MIVFEKQPLKALHNIEHEPFQISMEIFLPTCFAYIPPAPCIYTHPKRSTNVTGNNCLPLKMRNSQSTELKSNPCEVYKGFILALLSVDVPVSAMFQ